MSEIPEYLFLDLSLLYGSDGDTRLKLNMIVLISLILIQFIRKKLTVSNTNSFSTLLFSTKNSIILHNYLIYPNLIIKYIL